MRDIVLVYTPDMKGTWTVNFTWPGDDTYSAVSKVDTFIVGDHFEKRDSFAMLSLRPYPAIGLNQELLVNAWVTPPPFTPRDYYENYTFTIRKPDGSVAYRFSMNSEAPGVAWWVWYFDILGNWTITFEFFGDHFTKPCSVTQTITVQQDPIPYPIEDTPLPTEAWTFPVNVFNREWRNIAGPWCESYYNASKGSFNPYTTAPKSAHVLWKLEPLSGVGGFIGATASSSGITTSNQYSATAANINTIMAGRGYYTSGGKIYCINMSDGQQLWSVTGSFSVGATRNRVPVLYNFGTNFTVYDALTGAVTLNVAGLPSVYWLDPYVISSSGGRLIKWDTTGTSTNFTSRIVWNVTNLLRSTASGRSIIQDNLLICIATAGDTMLHQELQALNLTTGEMEYVKSLMDSDSSKWTWRQGASIGSGFGLVYFSGWPVENEGLGYIAYDAGTGEVAWVSEKTEYPWGNFWAYMPQGNGYNMIYGLGYSGVYAFNASNGKIVWHYTAGNSGMETPYNTWSFGSNGPVIGGGIVFAPSTEHTPQLYYRGTELHAIDAFSGEKVWSILGYYNTISIAYGTLVAQETPSGYTYAFSKGETVTTISVQNDVITKGNRVLIKGTIMDLSPAQPNTPCVSDDCMSAWMEYLHMQQPKPANVTGVTVKLTAIAVDGTTVDIGSAVSTVDGQYAFAWTPSDEGLYWIKASFEGSESYYASEASTAINVGPAAVGSSPSVTSPPTSPSTTDSPAPTTTTSALPTDSTIPTSSPSAIPGPESTTGTEVYIAIAAAVIIVAVIAVALVLRRRSK